jgi:urease accessory protein
MPAEPLPAPAPHQRSRGRAVVAFVADGGHARLARLAQQGSAKAFVLPGPLGPEVVFLNTSGGLTAGDRLALALDVPAGARVTGTTQTAERLYRAAGGHAEIDIALTVGAGGHLDWLPQETILFDGCAARRRTTLDLAEGARALAVEALVLGRAAMGETVARLALHDTRLIRRAGRVVHLEPLVLAPVHLGDRPALLAGARAVASLVMVAPGAADALGPVRAALDEPGVTAAASAPDGRLVVRLMAPDAWPLRRQLARLIRLLRHAPLPRVWQI